MKDMKGTQLRVFFFPFRVFFFPGLVAPEFQIFTPPNALAFANGMVSLIDNGLAECDQGFGVTVSDCSSGSFTFQEVGREVPWGLKSFMPDMLAQRLHQ